jgi:hypothetical protein
MDEERVGEAASGGIKCFDLSKGPWVPVYNAEALIIKHLTPYHPSSRTMTCKNSVSTPS